MKLSVSKLEVSFSKSLVLGLFSTGRFPPLLLSFLTEGGLVQVEERPLQKGMWQVPSGGRKCQELTP